jgi:hypothetical protein
MCFTRRIINSQLEELKIKKEELIEESTTYDRLFSHAYHEFEGVDLSSELGMIIAKRMQDTLRERRKIKYDIMQIKTLTSSLESTLKRLVNNEKDYFKGNENYKEYIYH